MTLNEHLVRASDRLSLFNILYLEGHPVRVAALLPHCPLLSAPWHEGPEMHVIAIDVNGNFFLRHASGGVSLWTHQSKTSHTIASSVKAFCDLLKRGE